MPPSSGRSSVRFFPHMPRSWFDPGGTLDACHFPRGIVSSGIGFSILLLDLLPRLYIYGAISSFRRLRAALWPAGFPVYASAMTFPHPSATLRQASGFVLLSRCLPRISNGLAVMSATLGSYNWLGFITYGLSPYQKRLALLGAQRRVLLRLTGGEASTAD